MALKDWKLKSGTRGTYEKKDGSWLILSLRRSKQVYISQFKKTITKNFKTKIQASTFAKAYMKKH